LWSIIASVLFFLSETSTILTPADICTTDCVICSIGRFDAATYILKFVQNSTVVFIGSFDPKVYFIIVSDTLIFAIDNLITNNLLYGKT
jgi:hypothetical protein